MYQATNVPPKGAVENLLLKPGCGLTLIPHKLSKAGNETRLRLIPQTDQAGNIYSGLLSDGPVNAPQACLDDSFSHMEVARLWLYNKELVFLSSIRPVDDEGKPVQLLQRSPANLVIRNFFYKMMAETIRTGKGYPTDLPESWWEFHQRGVATQIPTEHLLVQAIAYQINGDILQSPVAGVFCIPDQAKPGFLSSLLQRKDPNGSLAPQNLLNDAFTPQGGKLLVLQRMEDPVKKGLNNKPKVVYTLQFNTQAPLDPAIILSIYKPWEQVLHYMTINEQIKLLMEHFPADVVDFGLRRTPYAQYLPESVRGSSNRIQPEPMKIEELKKLPTYSGDGSIVVPATYGSTANAATPGQALPRYVPPVAAVQQQQAPVRQAVPVPPAPVQVAQPVLTPIASMVPPADVGQAAASGSPEALARFRQNFANASKAQATHA